MAQIRTITVSSTAASAIAAQTPCSVVAIGEDPGVVNWPTTDFLISKALSGPQRRLKAGQVYLFDAPRTFQTGETIGYVQTVSGTTTFFIDEGYAER